MSNDAMENCRIGCANCHSGSMHTEGKRPERVG